MNPQRRVKASHRRPQYRWLLPLAAVAVAVAVAVVPKPPPQPWPGLFLSLLQQFLVSFHLTSMLHHSPEWTCVTVPSLVPMRRFNANPPVRQRQLFVIVL